MFEDPGASSDPPPVDGPRVSPTDAFSSLLALPVELTFTPWFKLIARDFLFGWWDTLLASPRTANGLLDARSDAIRALEDDKVWKM